MYTYQDIRTVHLEISSLCNARCPQCPRNFYGYPFNDGYIEKNMSLADAQIIFKPDFLQQITQLVINGNFGDIVMNPESIDIIKYFKSHNPNLEIIISTNAGARKKEFWQTLAKLDCKVWFCIDGLEDTHHFYRQGTLYKRVLANAMHFISAGGHAEWKMIKFDFNQHQIDEARTRSINLGFKKFQLIDTGRNTGPVYDSRGKLVRVLGNYKPISFAKHFKEKTFDTVELDDITKDKPVTPIDCKVQKNASVYVSSTGDIYPCCFLGFSPNTFGHGGYHQAANAQVAKLIKENNAIEFSIEHAMSLFGQVSNSWNTSDFKSGRLVICQDVCGSKQVDNPNK